MTNGVLKHVGRRAQPKHRSRAGLEHSVTVFAGCSQHGLIFHQLEPGRRRRAAVAVVLTLGIHAVDGAVGLSVEASDLQRLGVAQRRDQPAGQFSLAAVGTWGRNDDGFQAHTRIVQDAGCRRQEWFGSDSGLPTPDPGLYSSAMPRRLLHFRFTFAVIGCAALLAGAWLDSIWLAGPGVAAAAVSELIGILQARARFPLASDRGLRGAAEGLPALGLTAFEPAAIWLTIAVVIYALMANGVQTVSVSRGAGLTFSFGETLRRVVTSLSSLVVLALPFAATGHLLLPARLTSLEVALVASGVAGLAGAFALTLMWRSIGKGAPAPNVDT